ncbi:MAG: hypothetical protein KC443_10765 [Anaerolineales bacterium]|nr:hypothetical protein [Anaerolineales bacterium]
MTEQENPLIQITADDISEANRLSLHCPICASPVESNPTEPALVPVVCGGCKTLYHRACWEQAGGKCAILGCNHDKYSVYGRPSKPALKIEYQDLTAAPSANGRPDRTSQRTKELKREQQRQVEELRRPSLLRRLWQWLLDQIRIEE